LASPKLPDRIIDVATLGGNPRLINGSGISAPYATLGHCWGGVCPTMTIMCVSLALQFTRYTVNCILCDSVSHLLTHLVVYIIATFSSLNTTTFCLIHVYTVPPHLTMCNLEQRMAEIPFGHLPKTFREAVKVCRAFMIPYLWIDSICIIQDSDQDWDRQSSKMHSIYYARHNYACRSRCR
jgi:hypothetical protein